MAEALNIRLSPEAISKLKEAASRLGRTPEELAAELLADAFYDPADFPEATGEALPSYTLSEPTHAWEDVRAEMLAAMEDGKRRRA